MLKNMLNGICFRRKQKTTNTILDKICRCKFEQKVHLTFQCKSKTNEVEMIYPLPADRSSTVAHRQCNHLANVSEAALQQWLTSGFDVQYMSIL